MRYFLFLFLLVSCATKFPPLKKVDYVDIPRFMGKWYVIANIPTVVEKGARNSIEEYSWNEKEDRIDVMFTMMKDGEKKEYPQKAWVQNKSGSHWKIQFFWPLKFDYLVIDLAPDYSWTVVGVPDRDFVWIMARGPDLKKEVLDGITNRLKAQHYEVEKIKMVPQVWD